MARIFSFLILLFLSALSTPAQVKHILSVVPTQKAISGKDLKLRVEFADVTQISEAKLLYRRSGESEFSQTEIRLSRESIVSIIIPGKNVKEPSLEILIEVVDNSGKISYFPGENRDETVRIPVSGSVESDKIIILSPERGAKIRMEDLFVCVSLIEIEHFDPTKSQILFNDIDVTKFSLISQELITFVPDNVNFNLKPGLHKISVTLKDTAGKVVARTSWEFNILSSIKEIQTKQTIDYKTNLEMELRQESANKASNFYIRGRSNFSGSYSFFNFNANLYLTSEERSNIQPQHRFLIEGNLSNWIKVAFGDVHPNFSPLVLSGYRVRGMYGKVDFKYFQFEIVNGETKRKIEGTILRRIPIDSLSGTLPQNSLYDTTSRRVIVYEYGTYERRLFAIKPVFRFKRNFEFGFTYLVSEDNKTSIKFGGNPQKNVVLGSNLLISLDDLRAEIQAQGALSIRNENLKAKSWADADIDSIFKDAPELKNNLKKYRPLLEKLVPINQYVVPLKPISFSNLAYEVGVNLNYFGNFLKVDYIFHGNEYLSFGQPYLRQDVQGFKVFDRLRLLENQVLLTFRLESLRDNTGKQRDYTTNFISWEVSATYSPLVRMPSFSLAYSKSTSKNGVPKIDTLRALNLRVDKLSFDLDYSFEYYFKNRVNFTFSVASSDDKTVLNSDLWNLNILLSLHSDLRENLRSNVTISFSSLKYTKPIFNLLGRFVGTYDERLGYISVSVGSDYKVGKIRFLGNFSPSFGSLRRLYVHFGSSYEIAQNQTLSFNSSLLFYRSFDLVAYLTYKVSF